MFYFRVVKNSVNHYFYGRKAFLSNHYHFLHSGSGTLIMSFYMGTCCQSFQKHLFSHAVKIFLDKAYEYCAMLTQAEAIPKANSLSTPDHPPRPSHTETLEGYIYIHPPAQRTPRAWTVKISTTAHLNSDKEPIVQKANVGRDERKLSTGHEDHTTKNPSSGSVTASLV